jgi:uncharacterized protein YndB with AHSA1/START domain
MDTNRGKTIHELQDGFSEQQNATVRLNHADTDVRVSVVIEAEWPRIFNALTVPEYLDVWLTMPGVERLECRAEQKTQGGFRIDIFVGGSLQRAIHGSCIRSRPDEISYLWEKSRAQSAEKSVVRLRLRGGPRRCSLHLKHHGLWDQKERDWYFIMWRRSLDKLRGIMEKRSADSESWASI